MRVNNLPRVALDSGAAGIRTHDLLIASPAPYHYATEPHYTLHTCLQMRLICWTANVHLVTFRPRNRPQIHVQRMFSYVKVYTVFLASKKFYKQHHHHHHHHQQQQQQQQLRRVWHSTGQATAGTKCASVFNSSCILMSLTRWRDRHRFLWFSRLIFSSRFSRCGAVYCNRSCLFVGLWLCLWLCYHDNWKLRASILTKLGV